jgi:glucose-1-phosphate adenylyltransferase
MRITAFLEKPKDPPSIPGDPDHALASMGIYVFDWAFLRDLLKRDMVDDNSSHDFGNDLIPPSSRTARPWRTSLPTAA